VKRRPDRFAAFATLPTPTRKPRRMNCNAASPNSYGAAWYTSTIDAPQFVDTAPISAPDKAKLAHLNAARLLLGHHAS
jgi:hypothetical protein